MASDCAPHIAGALEPRGVAAVVLRGLKHFDSVDGDGNADDGDDKPDDGGDTGAKPEGACETDFDPDEPCEGSREETMCTDDDGMLWWCEGGEWKNTDDKP